MCQRTPLVPTVGEQRQVGILISGQLGMAQRLRALSAYSREPGFNSQNSHGSSQLSKTPVSGDLTLFLTSEATRHTHTDKTFIHLSKKTNRAQMIAVFIKELYEDSYTREEKQPGEDQGRSLCNAVIG